jgi:hypothetical protein
MSLSIKPPQGGSAPPARSGSRKNLSSPDGSYRPATGQVNPPVHPPVRNLSRTRPPTEKSDAALWPAWTDEDVWAANDDDATSTLTEGGC